MPRRIKMNVTQLCRFTYQLTGNENHVFQIVDVLTESEMYEGLMTYVAVSSVVERLEDNKMTTFHKSIRRWGGQIVVVFEYRYKMIMLRRDLDKYVIFTKLNGLWVTNEEKSLKQIINYFNSLIV